MLLPTYSSQQACTEGLGFEIFQTIALTVATKTNKQKIHFT